MERIAVDGKPNSGELDKTQLLMLASVEAKATYGFSHAPMV